MKLLQGYRVSLPLLLSLENVYISHNFTLIQWFWYSAKLLNEAKLLQIPMPEILGFIVWATAKVITKSRFHSFTRPVEDSNR